MKKRFTSLLAFAVLSAGCKEILGENFKGYRGRCAESGSPCSGGSAGASASAESGGTDSVGGAGPALPRRNGTPADSISMRGLDPVMNAAGQVGGRGSVGNVNRNAAAEAGAPASTETGGGAGSTGIAAPVGDGGTPSAGTTGTVETGGVAGWVGSGGVAGLPGAGGSAGVSSFGGAVATGGATGSTYCQPDAPVVPECESVNGSYFPYVGIPAARGVMMLSAEQYGGGFQAFASKRDSSLIAQLWNEAAGEENWTPWVCFDSLPQPDRLAGHSLLSGTMEVFATTACGALFRRAELPTGWEQWVQTSLPLSGRAATDVAVSEAADDINIVYLAEGGRIFARPRLGAEPSSPYGDWQELLGAETASIVTGGLRSDQRQQVFMIDTRGTVSTAIQSTKALDSPFGAWSDFDSNQLPLPLVDIEAPLGGPLPLEVYAVDSEGHLWQRTQDQTSGVFGPWTEWAGPSTPAPLSSLSGAGLKLAPNTPLRLTVLTTTGHVYTVRRTANSWGDWRLFP